MSDQKYRLITAGPSPYGRKVEIALVEKGLDFETIYDLPWGEAVETRKHSPLEQLPILLSEDREPIYDSTLIMDYLELAHPSPPLRPDGMDARLCCMKRRILGERLMEIAQALVFESHRENPARQTIERQSRKIVGGLDALERLFETRPQTNIDCDQGDIAVASTLLCWDFIIAEGMSPPLEVFDWSVGRLNLKASVSAADQSPSFAATRPQSMQVNIQGEVASPEG